MCERGRQRETREISILTKGVRLQEQALSTPTKPQGPVSQMTTLSINMDEVESCAAASTGARPPTVTVAAAVTNFPLYSPVQPNQSTQLNTRTVCVCVVGFVSVALKAFQ